MDVEVSPPLPAMPELIKMWSKDDPYVGKGVRQWFNLVETEPPANFDGNLPGKVVNDKSGEWYKGEVIGYPPPLSTP